MKLNIILIILFTLSSLSCQEAKQTVAEKHPISGLWTLHIMETRDSLTGEWSEWRDGMQGYLLYHEEGSMALHLTVKAYQNTPLRFENFNPDISEEALKHLTGSYVYFGKYELNFEDSIVQHKRISHSNPGMWNEKVERRFSFKGDTLVLKPVEESLANLRLKWIRKD